jgi:hypothetical protein
MKNKTVVKLRKAKEEGILTNQQFNTLKGQVLSGRERAAAKGFMSIMKSNKKERERKENN